MRFLKASNSAIAARKAIKAMRRGNLKDAQHWMVMAERITRIELVANNQWLALDINKLDLEQRRLHNEQLKVRLEHTKKWPRGYGR